MSLLATPKSSPHNRKLASRNRAYKREKLNPAIISQGGSRRKTAFMQLYWKLSGEAGSKGGHSHALLAAWGWGVEACCSSGVLTMAAMTTMGCFGTHGMAQNGTEPWLSWEPLEVDVRQHMRHQKGGSSFGELNKV